jgi:DNA repair protein NreA
MEKTELSLKKMYIYVINAVPNAIGIVLSSSPAEIKKKLEENWIRFIKANSAKLLLGTIDGSSPPSIFVGRYGYPKVRIGPMIPPLHGDTTILDRTELWTGKNLEEIANYRLSLVLGTMNVNIHDISSRYLENMQELAMSERPAETEATFEKTPVVDVHMQKELRLDHVAPPFGPAAPLRGFKMSSLSADQRIETVYYDTDLRAADAMMELYRRSVEMSIIQRVLSMGMLGVKKKRKLVPTRWSISATDDIISSMLVKEIEMNPTIDLFEVTRYSHLANYYSIILIPDDRWIFEMIESWFTSRGQVATGADNEDERGLNHNPTIAGAYFAARLAVAEHLARRHKKAGAIVLREIHPNYVIPLGVWQIREGVREALKKPPQKFERFDHAMSFACSYMSLSKNEVVQKSRLWKSFKGQTKISDFA